MQPRIYVYKITFEEVPYYYYGVKKEKYFNEEYWGSPKTNKWCWELYTPKKQILEIFPYTNEGWIEAKEVEDRLIKPFYNTDKWCLNEAYGGLISLEVLRKTGKKSGKKLYELGIGMFSLTPEQRRENSRKGAKVAKELKVGIYGLTSEQLSEYARKSGKKQYELGIGIHGRTQEEMKENGRKSGQKSKELGIGIHGLTLEQRQEIGRKAYEEGKGIHAFTKEQRQEIARKVISQRWQCTVTGHITNAGSLSIYQKKRGIDTSKRIRIE